MKCKNTKEIATKTQRHQGTPRRKEIRLELTLVKPGALEPWWQKDRQNEVRIANPR